MLSSQLLQRVNEVQGLGLVCVRTVILCRSYFMNELEEVLVGALVSLGHPEALLWLEGSVLLLLDLSLTFLI